MSQHDTAETDERLGYVIALAAIAVLGALGMIAAPGQLLAAGGFATAVGAGLLMVLVLHVMH